MGLFVSGDYYAFQDTSNTHPLYNAVKISMGERKAVTFEP